MKVVLDHIGIAVSNLAEALAFYRDALGFEITVSEEVETQGVRAHFLATGGTSLELLEVTTDSSPVAQFIGHRGPGLHHITLRVDDINQAITHLETRGVQLIDKVPRLGARGALIAFVHPSSAHGVLVELKEEKMGINNLV